MTWKDGSIEDCEIRRLKRYSDERGWLLEFFRNDELAGSARPVMGYVSLTYPDVVRGPHEHAEQTDLFIFFDGLFCLYLWDSRTHSPTCGNRQIMQAGAARPLAVSVPPGVVHAYKNIGEADALMINCPNALYAGKGKKHPVDEIRHENVPGSPYAVI